MNTTKLLARVVRWRYWKQLHALKCVGQLTHAGLYSLKFQIMSLNTLSKETEMRLAEFFNQATDPKSFTKAIRKVNYLLAMSLMRECETLQIDPKSVEQGYFWLNELAEILNPYFEIED
ncbi:hypothetical protein [Flavobacterium johnsoniae]|uniref:hypothetical protein n=1 Tax=Flavobacterium johnsoniae TaxID=986 RepID=UPI00292A5900|nr:hypothetical protein [Flavobacterium johnsoniae]